VNLIGNNASTTELIDYVVVNKGPTKIYPENCAKRKKIEENGKTVGHRLKYKTNKKYKREWKRCAPSAAYFVEGEDADGNIVTFQMQNAPKSYTKRVNGEKVQVIKVRVITSIRLD